MQIVLRKISERSNLLFYYFSLLLINNSDLHSNFNLVAYHLIEMEKSYSFVSGSAIFNMPYTTIGELYNSNTSFSWETVDKDPLHLKIRIKNIVLKQDPSETLDLEIHFDSIPTQDQFNYLFKVTNMEIKFHNNLHEFDKNYIYEILCRHYVEYGYPSEYLFSLVKSRKSSKITETGKAFSTSFKLNSRLLYIYIRRIYRYERENEVRQYVDFHSLLQDVPTDIELGIGEEILSAHKFVLSRSSEVFEKMFSNEMLEAKTGVVKIEDFSVEVMREMLDFLYTGRIVHVEMRYELLKVAHKYELQDLYDRCKEYIIFNSTIENIAETLEIADMYDINQFKVSCTKFINNHKRAMSKEPSYHNYLCRAITLDNVVDTLLFARKYDIESVTKTALDFISDNYCKLKGDKSFSKLFESNPSLMREIFHHYCEKHIPAVVSSEAQLMHLNITM